MLPWLAYAAFHLGDYKFAQTVYEEILRSEDADPTNWIYLACAQFFQGLYKEAEVSVGKGPTCKLQSRIGFHLAHKFNDENKLMAYHQKLQDITQDQLCLASIHYMRNHFQEAIEICKRIILENREFVALNVYVALCYYKLDYYEVALEVLNTYMQAHPESLVAMNLKACNTFRLYDGKAAEAIIKTAVENSGQFSYGRELLAHNLVVFRGGEGSLQTLPGLIDVFVEARLNLVIYYLKVGDIGEAFNLMKDLEPTTPQEYILKGVVHAFQGQDEESREHLKLAQQYFQLVGSSSSECDTIPGRQAMASCLFLLKQFSEVLIYLDSIKSYCFHEDEFNWNLGLAKANAGQYKDAEAALLLVQSEKYRQEYGYLSWLARCYIMNGKPRAAWELYVKMETSGDSFSMLQLISNDCYKMGAFYYAAKAFDVLERLDPNPDFWEGKRGSCVGVFQQVIAGKEPKETLRDVVAMLRNTSNPQVEYIIRTIRKWAKDNGVVKI
jgi:intraflagellar transport protein 56